MSNTTNNNTDNNKVTDTQLNIFGATFLVIGGMIAVFIAAMMNAGAL